MNILKLKNPLTDESKPWGIIRFINLADNKENYFYTCVNKLTGDRLSAFNKDSPSINESLVYVTEIFNSIRRNAKPLEYIGSKHFKK